MGFADRLEEESPRVTSWIPTWLKIGRANEWIAEAWDPPFNTKSFYECKDDAELLDKLSHGNWSLGQAFHLGDLCFIQQIDGGDEYLTIKRDTPFESISFGRIINRSREEGQELLNRLKAAPIEKCRSLDY